MGATTSHRPEDEIDLVLGDQLFIKLMLAEKFERKQKDFRSLLRRIEASGAEAIISNALRSVSVAQVRQLRELNINVKMFAALRDAETPEFIKELGGLAEYVVGFTYWEPKPVLGHPGIVEFVASYEKRFGEKPTFHAASGYATMQITVAAVKAAGSFDSEKVRDAMASILCERVGQEAGLTGRAGGEI